MSNKSELASKYQRVFSVTADQYGVDPLKDNLVPELLNVTAFHLHAVTQDERGSPDLISLREYGSDQFWWMILSYNGIGSYRLIVEGLTLKIPEYASLIAIVTHRSIRPTVVKRVVSI